MLSTKTSNQTDPNNAAILGWDADVHSAQDYYAFGMTMPGSNYSAPNKEGYRYGFNGKELDLEGMGGGGITYDYGFRIYNPQIAKFLSVDPLSCNFPFYTPYQFVGIKPVAAIDLDGLEELIFHYIYNSRNELTQIGLSRYTNSAGDVIDVNLVNGQNQRATTINPEQALIIHHRPDGNTFETKLRSNLNANELKALNAAPRVTPINGSIDPSTGNPRNGIQVKYNFGQQSFVGERLLSGQSLYSLVDVPKPIGENPPTPKLPSLSDVGSPILANGSLCDKNFLGDVDQLILDINANVKEGKKISLTINVQIGEGVYSDGDGSLIDNTAVEQNFSNLGLQNLVNYLQDNGLSSEVQINQGKVGPSQEKVISGAATSIQINVD